MLLWLENGDLGATVLEPQQLYFGKSCKTNGFSKKVNGTNGRTHGRTHGLIPYGLTPLERFV